MVNGPIASVCYVALLVDESDGSGTPKTMCGPKSTRNRSDDGFMWTYVKKPGIILDSMPKDGARRCPIASLSQPTVRQT